MDVAETAKGIRQRAAEISNAARENAKPCRIIKFRIQKETGKDLSLFVFL